jgi:hypothetical protein
MKKSILLFFVFSLAISLPAQDTSKVKVTEKAKATFAKLYSDVKEVKWVKKDKNEFKAEFKQDGKAISLLIDAEGNLKKTRSEISKSELPIGVEEFVAKNHNGWTITRSTKITGAKGNITFEAQITKDKMKKHLLFTKDGKHIIKKVLKEKKEKTKKIN